MLEEIYQGVQEVTTSHNKKAVNIKIKKNNYIDFIKSGEGVSSKRKKQNILSSANDWVVLADVGENSLTFPVSIYATPLRPDIVLFSLKAKKVIMIELTCPKEERMSISNQIKRDKYTKELVPGCQRNGWQAHLFPVEVGCRGFVSTTFDTCMRSIGMSGSKIKDTKKKCSRASLRCSYNIWLQRKNKEFSKW